MVEKLVMTTNKIVREQAKTFVMTTFEKITAALLFISVVLLMFATIHTRSVLDALQQEVETVRMDTQTVQDNNAILQQKIDNLMTADRLDAIAKQYGLTRNESNVRSVSR